MSCRDALITLSLLTMQSCFAPLDLEGRECPCGAGFVCDARDRCVRSDSSMDGGTIDAARDASDLGEFDLGVRTDMSSFDLGLDAFVASDAGPPDCPSGAFLCDDFESLVPDRVPPFTSAIGSARSTDRAHRGSASGHFVAAGSDPDPPRLEIVLGPTPTDLWMRYWAYIPESTTLNNVALGLFIESGPTNFQNMSVIADSNGWAFYNTVDMRFEGGPALLRDTWQCVSFHVRVGSPGSVELRVDDQSTTELSMNTAFTQPPIRAGAGITYVGSTQTEQFEVYIDDYAVSTDGTPLLCP